MKSNQKGAASAVVLGLTFLILAGIVAAYYWQKTPLTPATNEENNTPLIPVTDEDNSETPVVTPTPTSPTPSSPVVNTPPNVFPGGSQYRTPYGLTLAFPATWQGYTVSRSNPSFEGFSSTDSFTFSLSGNQILTINVFTKEQWNRIRTEENAANQNVNSLGEGIYLGENSTYIYSYSVHARQAEVQQVLSNIISF